MYASSSAAVSNPQNWESDGELTVYDWDEVFVTLVLTWSLILVAPLAKLAKWSAPFADKGSYLVALKGSSAAEEIERDANAVGIAGWRNEEVVQLHRDGGVDDTYVIRAIHI